MILSHAKAIKIFILSLANIKLTLFLWHMNYQDCQDPSVDSTLSRMAIVRGKKLKAYKYPHISQMMAKPHLALILIPLNIPILIACSILCLVLPHHCPVHAPNLSISVLSFCSCKPPECMLFLKLFDTVLKIHSSLQTHPQSHTTFSAKITP